MSRCLNRFASENYIHTVGLSVMLFTFRWNPMNNMQVHFHNSQLECWLSENIGKRLLPSGNGDHTSVALDNWEGMPSVHWKVADKIKHSHPRTRNHIHLAFGENPAPQRYDSTHSDTWGLLPRVFLCVCICTTRYRMLCKSFKYLWYACMIFLPPYKHTVVPIGSMSRALFVVCTVLEESYCSI